MPLQIKSNVGEAQTKAIEKAMRITSASMFGLGEYSNVEVRVTSRYIIDVKLLQYLCCPIDGFIAAVRKIRENLNEHIDKTLSLLDEERKRFMAIAPQEGSAKNEDREETKGE